MERYTIQLNYNAAITVTVVAENEGQALDMARDKAEDADVSQYTIWGERESTILNREGV